MSRNPRRAYDGEGTEIPPMTLGNMREHGVRSVLAICQEASCGLAELTTLTVASPAAHGFFPLLALALPRCPSPRSDNL
jgi:hypothetical protein